MRFTSERRRVVQLTAVSTQLKQFKFVQFRDFNKGSFDPRLNFSVFHVGKNFQKVTKCQNVARAAASKRLSLSVTDLFSVTNTLLN